MAVKNWRMTGALLYAFAIVSLFALMPRARADETFGALVADIEAANSGVSRTITLEADITLSAALPAIRGDVTIDGGGHTISGGGQFRIFDVNGGALTLTNVTLTEGNGGEGRGGAIRMRNGARVTIESATLSQNKAKGGGAIVAYGGAIRVVNSTFRKNCAGSIKSVLNHGGKGAEREERRVDADGCLHVTYYRNSMDEIIQDENGGAITLQNGARANIDGSTFSENRATSGGAIAAKSNSDKLTVKGSSFQSNVVSIDGGAIAADRGTASISASSFAQNAADSGGGAILVEHGALEVANSTFSENQSKFGAGALEIIGDARVTLTHLTFSDNWSLYRDAGAIENRGNGKLHMRNSIVKSEGRSEDCAGGFDQNIGNLSPDGTCAVRSSDDPLLGELGGSPAYHPLLDRSPAIDAAETGYCLKSDQLGRPRPQGNGCDIGAIEATTAEAAPAPILPPPACGLADQIIAANTDRAVAGCRAGNGADIIRLTRDILLFTRLPAITSFITIEGNGHTISGDGRFRIFDVDGGHLTVKRLTMTEGRSASQPGGAIRLQNGGRAVVNDSSFIRNWADVGGAIGFQSPFRGNERLTVTGSSFLRNNAAKAGGAIHMNSGSAVIENSSFTRNTAQQTGGAINMINYTRLEVINSSFIRNRASWGGGVLALENGARATLTHVTAYSDSLYALQRIESIYGAQSVISLRNSVIAGPATLLHCQGPLAENVGNLILGGSCSPMISDAPMLEEPTDSSTSISPLPGSLAVRAADPRFCPETDQVGQPRAIVGPCDIGAIESIPVQLAISDCAVTTIHVLNFRDAPNGAKIGQVPHNETLMPTARTPGWFQVEHDGASGWISADYVVTQGNCA